jgi:hydroxyethylthiazole kinase
VNALLDFTRLDEIRQQRPLVHCISNLVSANDCANLALAVGASPIMAQAPQELAEITAASRATVLNTGTPDAEKFPVCLLCGQEAARLGHPVVLDPVGVGASVWRLEQVQSLLAQVSPTIVRVNLGEAQALSRQHSQAHGVDSLTADFPARLETASRLAVDRRTTVLLSGPEDVITDGTRAWCVSGGSSWMALVTGTGCMLSVLCGIFAAVEPDPLRAAALAAAFWKVCARRAEQAAAGRGPGSFRTALLDTAWSLTAAEFSAEADVTVP